MSNLTITHIDSGQVIIEATTLAPDTLYVGGAGTVAKGTILARKRVATAVTAAADEGNTGDGTCTLASVVGGAIVPAAGEYTLKCIEAITHGGIFQLLDPNGAIVAGYLPMTAGAGAATTFEAAGMTFKLTDGDTDFAVGDFFTLTVAEDDKLVVFASDGVGGAQEPIAVLPYAVTVTGAGSVPASVLRAGIVNSARLVIAADGDASNVTTGILDALQAVGISNMSIAQLGVKDNY